MNIVIAGGGEIGLRIAEQLMTAHNVVYIGYRETDRARLERLEITGIGGAITSPRVLQNAEVGDADIFIAASREDEKNLVACVAARQLGARRVVCFLNRRGFVAEEGEEDGLAESLQIDAIVRPAGQLADEIIRIVTVPGALDVRSFYGGRIQLQKFELDTSSPLVGEPLNRYRFPEGALAAMGQRGDEFFVPRGQTVFEAGDRVTVMGTPQGLRRLQRQLAAPRHRRRRGRAIVVGGGLVGSAVADGLNDAGWLVKVIEFDRARCSEIAASLDCLVIQGDGSDLDLLEHELADDPDALIAVTSNDEKNLLISLLAQHLKVPRVITRADRLINERIFEKVGVDVVLSAKGASIRRVVNELIQADERHLAELEHGDFNVLDLALPESFIPARVSDLRLPEFAIIGAILRSGKALIPTGRNTLSPRDHLLIICSAAHEDALYDSLGIPRASKAAP